MYIFWLIVMSGHPYFILFGLFGFLGKDAKKAAEVISVVWGFLIFVVIFCVAIYQALHWLGFVH